MPYHKVIFEPIGVSFEVEDTDRGPQAVKVVKVSEQG